MTRGAVLRVGATALAVAVGAIAVGPPASQAATNLISTVAGTGTAGYTGDNGPATAAQLGTPVDVTPLPDGSFLIAEQGAHIRRVAPDGTITTLAGSAGRPATWATAAPPPRPS